MRPTAWRGQLHTRMAKEVEAHGIAKRGEVWLNRMYATILRSAGARVGPSTTAELREAIPPLARRLELAPGKSYGGNVPIAPRVLGTLGCPGQPSCGAATRATGAPRGRGGR